MSFHYTIFRFVCSIFISNFVYLCRTTTGRTVSGRRFILLYTDDLSGSVNRNKVIITNNTAEFINKPAI